MTLPPTVLIVDDAVFMRSLLKDIFLKNNFQVVAEAANGLEAVELFKLHRPSVTTMDIIMPELNGIEALRRIIEFDPEARVVMCSALGQESLVAESIAAGARDFIIKPFTPDRVIAVVRQVLEE